jgi:lipoprotein-releasing system permease protein
MNVPVELSLALRYLRPRRTFVSIITLLSFGGVAIAVMVLIVVLSVMTGFRQRLDEKIIGFNAHITVSSDEIIYDSGKLVEQIEKQPGVLAAEGVLPDALTVRGVFQTGQYSYDSDFLLVSTETAQHIYGLDDGVQEIAVRVKDLSQVDAVRDELNKILPQPLIARTWMDDNHDLFNALATERVVMTFILMMVMIVAGFGLCSTLITITVQKAREIGLMKALGANDTQVYSVFLLHSLVVGVVGAVSGTVFGLLVLHYRNPFRDFLLQRFGIQVFAADVYGPTEIPAVINPMVITLIALAAVVICVLAAFFPALSAARLAPARALRYE